MLGASVCQGKWTRIQTVSITKTQKENAKRQKIFIWVANKNWKSNESSHVTHNLQLNDLSIQVDSSDFLKQQKKNAKINHNSEVKRKITSVLNHPHHFQTRTKTRKLDSTRKITEQSNSGESGHLTRPTWRPTKPSRLGRAFIHYQR